MRPSVGNVLGGEIIMSDAQQLEILLKQLIDKGIITEWYKNGEGYHWTFKEDKNENDERPRTIKI